MSSFRDQLETWVKGLEIVANTVIDVGGGQKPMTKRSIKKWDVKSYYILDNDPEFKPDLLVDMNKTFEESGYMSPQNFGSGNGNGICIRPEEDVDRCFSKFEDAIRADVVLALEVSEYIYAPLQFHRNIWNLLKDNKSRAYISYCTIYPLHPPEGIDYLRYSKNAIIKYLEIAGFKSWKIIPRVATDTESLSRFYRNEGMRPMKNTRDIFNIGYLVEAWK